MRIETKSLGLEAQVEKDRSLLKRQSERERQDTLRRPLGKPQEACKEDHSPSRHSDQDRRKSSKD